MTDTPFPVARVLDTLRVKWAGRPCQMCGIGNWNVSAKLFELREFQSGSLSVGGPVVPVIPIVCTNCGNTVLINAIIAGVVPPVLPTPEVRP